MPNKPHKRTELPLELHIVESDNPLPRRKSYKGADSKRQRDKLQSLPFIGWDGEGYTDDEGEHHYMLFGNSSGEYVAGESLTYRECFPLLLNSSNRGNNVIYGGDYDVIMMTKGMPRGVLWRLLHGLPVKHQGYRMQWFRKKYFMLSQGRGSERKAIILYDVLSFFGCSFVNACKQYLGNDDALIKMHEMKLKRGDFTKDDAAIIPYWQSELQYLVRLMDCLRSLLLEAGIKPKGWYGPGAVASGLLSAHKMKQHLGNTPELVTDAGERAYYGGRFEQFKVGKFDQAIEYDIRSAYPRAITYLPSLSNCNWVYEAKWSGKFHPFGLYRVSWDFSKIANIATGVPGPLPWRSELGNIYYPLKGTRSWYWGVEARNLEKKDAEFTVHEAWLPFFDPEVIRPFGWVQEMYDTRARMKREGNPAQLAVKLGLNSLYGKLAQSKGANERKDGSWRKPEFHQILWAGWITAFTRSQVFQAAWRANTRLIAIETDAVFTMKPIPQLKESESLGDWERTDIESILYVNSGVYYSLNDGVWRLKSRGVEADRSKSAEYWKAIFLRLPHTRTAVTLKVSRFGTDLRSKTFGNWYEYSSTTELPTLHSKRVHHPSGCIPCIMKLGSYAKVAHTLVVPEEVLNCDIAQSIPYPFPWRTDGSSEWPKEWVVTELDRDLMIEWV